MRNSSAYFPLLPFKLNLSSPSEQFVKGILSQPPHKRTKLDIQFLGLFGSQVEFIAKQPDQTRDEVLRYSQYLVIEEDKEIFHSGYAGTTFYVILQGKVSVYADGNLPLGSMADFEKFALLGPEFPGRDSSVQDVELIKAAENNKTPFLKQLDFIRKDSVVIKDKKSVHFLYKVNTLGPGQSFGELALLEESQNRRTATIITDSQCHFATLDKKHYRMILGKQEQREISEAMDLLDSIRIFNQWDRKTTKTLRYIMKAKKFPRNSPLFLQDQPPTSLFLIRNGRVRLERSVSFLDLVPHQNKFSRYLCFKKKKTIPFAYICGHEIIGEEDVYFNQLRSFSCVCDEECDVFEIDGVELMKRVLLDNSKKKLFYDEILKKRERLEDLFTKAQECFKKNITMLSATNLTLHKTISSYKIINGNQKSNELREKIALTSKDDEQRDEMIMNNLHSKIAETRKVVKEQEGMFTQKDLYGLDHGSINRSLLKQSVEIFEKFRKERMQVIKSKTEKKLGLSPSENVSKEQLKKTNESLPKSKDEDLLLMKISTSKSTIHSMTPSLRGKSQIDENKMKTPSFFQKNSETGSTLPLLNEIATKQKNRIFRSFRTETQRSFHSPEHRSHFQSFRVVNYRLEERKKEELKRKNNDSEDQPVFSSFLLRPKLVIDSSP